MAGEGGSTLLVVAPARKKARTPRKVTVATFGGMLRSTRGKMSLGKVVTKLQHRRPGVFDGLSTGTLHNLERGTVNRPDPLLLQELAALYGKNLLDWLLVLLRNREDRELSTVDVVDVREDDMRINDGVERDIITQYRGLKGREQHGLLEHLRWLASNQEVVAANPAAQTFRKRR